MDLPYNPILGMGLEPSILFYGGVWILRGLFYFLQEVKNINSPQSGFATRQFSPM